jgi:cell division protein FtsI (penicillin-binding protein 3)
MVAREKRRFPFIVLLITALILLIIIFRTIFIMLSVPSKAKEYKNPQVASRVVRGTIYDREGRILAIEIPYYNCALLLREVGDLGAVANSLGRVLSISPQTIVENASKNTTYYLVKSKLSPNEVTEVKNLKLKGVSLEKEYGRFYPQHYHASNLLGFTNRESVGLEGLEYSLNTLLLPHPRLNEEVTFGSDLYLTIDLDLQYLLDEQAVAIDALHHPDEISAIIMEAKTGAILALTNFPWYDPNEFSTSNPAMRQNRVVSTLFEPGSVFKIFSLAAILEAHQATLDEPFDCDGTYTYTTESGSKVVVNCTSPHGIVDPKGMLKYSCNGAVAHWALQTDSNLFRESLADFGFNTKWELPLPGVSKGNLKEVSTFSGRSKPTISFGQEVGVNALQLVTAATALANNGNLYTPYLIDKVVASDGTIEKRAPLVAKEGIISAETAQLVLAGMVEATELGGTATRSAVKGVEVASKTGTAQIIDPESGTYDSSAFLASTLSIFPADNPAYIIFIGVKNPKGATIWGANIASPAIASIIESMVSQGKIISTVSERVTLAGQPD